MQLQIVRVFGAILLAHLLGDFPFQSSRLATLKVRHWWAQAWHGAIHLLLLVLALRFFVAQLPLFTERALTLSLAYVALHVAIDVGKQQIVRRGFARDSTPVFVLDQLLHLITIVGLSVVLTGNDWASFRTQATLSGASEGMILSGAIVYTAVIFAGGYLIRYMTRGLLRGVSVQLGESVEQLTNAGLYIGWLERLLIVTAVVLHSPTLIGLILTAKSIARFPEIKESKFAEYFLIGTLLSVSVALFGGLLLLKLWYGTVSLQ
jgi:hypothetical protein